jgi:succinate dehydrogenase/fumarate reductase flavoprotein subunit
MSIHTSPATLVSGSEYDVLVLGAGAAGMAAALFAALAGAKVLLVERTEYVGGTSALSGGTTWVPLTRYQRNASSHINDPDSLEKVSQFLDLAVGEHAPRAMREAFLAAGPAAIHTLVDNTDVDFRVCAFHPDYMADLDGATGCGRALEPLPYITRHLGKNLALLRPPIPEFTVLNGMMINRQDIGHLLNRFKSVESALYTVRLGMRYVWDRVRYGQTARSVMGHALIARMLSSALKLGIDIVTNTDASKIEPLGGGKHRVTLNGSQSGNTDSREILVTGGVILAGGGMGRDPEKRKMFYPSLAQEYSPTAPGCAGTAHRLVESMGSWYGNKEDQPAFWAPCSIRQRKDGTTAVFPHFVFDRAKPGILTVNQNGDRFVNESLSYHEFGKAMLNPDNKATPAYIIADTAAITKYGLGMVRLGGDPLSPYLKDGYLIKGNTLAELASKLAIPEANLKAAVAQMNAAANSGLDTQFQRGTTVYQRANGDPDHCGPNPCLGVLTEGPYYAVHLYPTDIGSAKGLMSDVDGQLIRADGSVIEGIYACGNDLNSIMGGNYPGPGITIGPGIVFGYLAAQNAVQRSKSL